MNRELRISESLSLPVESATWVLAYLAKRGAGKTYCASVQAEEMLKQHIPIVVLDGMGIWWGLRVGRNGVGEGLPIVVFGGEHADLPLVQEKASEIAAAIVESNISCVLDLSEFSKYASKKIVTAFLNELYRLNRVERHVFIEEADMFCPQKPFGPEEQNCLSAVDNFVRRGGNRNLGCTLITQRSAVINKDVLTQSDCLVVLRTLAPNDKKAVQAWVEEQTDAEEQKAEMKKWYNTLKKLKNGEAWIWHPEDPEIFDKVKFRERETFHATREFIKSPNANKIILMNVGDFVQKFKDVFETPKQTQLDSDQTKRLADIKSAGLEDMIRLGEENQYLKRQIEDLKGQVNDMGIDNLKIESEKQQIEEEVKNLENIRAELFDTVKMQDAQLKTFGPLSELFTKMVAERVDEQLDQKFTELETRLASNSAFQPASSSPSNEETQLVVESSQAELIVKVNRPLVTIDEKTLRGQVAMLISEGIFDKPIKTSVAATALRNLYPKSAAEGSFLQELFWFTEQQILTHDAGAGGSHHTFQVKDKNRIKVEKN